MQERQEQRLTQVRTQVTRTPGQDMQVDMTPGLNRQVDVMPGQNRQMDMTPDQNKQMDVIPDQKKQVNVTPGQERQEDRLVHIRTQITKMSVRDKQQEGGHLDGSESLPVDGTSPPFTLGQQQTACYNYNFQPCSSPVSSSRSTSMSSDTQEQSHSRHGECGKDAPNDRKTHQGGVEKEVPEVTVLQATQHGEQHVQPCIDGQAPPLASTKHLEQHMKQCNHGKGPSLVNTQNAGHAKTLTATPPDLAVDSDDEECDVVVTESLPVRDAIRDCLDKQPTERSEEDIDLLMDFMQHFRAFANLTHMTRRAMCSVMLMTVLPRRGSVVMTDGEELDSWFVILNGQVEVVCSDDTHRSLQMGDGFGITATMQKLYHKGVMRTLTDDFQFVRILQQDYYRILHQGEENTRKHMEQGKVVMVTEHRELDGGERRGHVVIRGTAERLMQHLVEDHSTLDPTYVEDFLLGCRTFLSSLVQLTNKLLEWVRIPTYRPKVVRVVLLWVNNHFSDFETDGVLWQFLEQFEDYMEKENMVGEVRLLNMACTAKATVRTVSISRAAGDTTLPFSMVGGQDKGQGIFITSVESKSQAAAAGLHRGDQILEVNGVKFHPISLTKAMDTLKTGKKFSISVQSNLQDFRKAVQQQTDKVVHRRGKGDRLSHSVRGHLAKHRLSVPDLDTTLSYITMVADKKPDRKGLLSIASNSRIKKALEKMIPRFNGLNHSEENPTMKRSRKTSVSSLTDVGGQLSLSNPDLSTVNAEDHGSATHPLHIIKVFRADQAFRLLPIDKETTSKEAVRLALLEFGIAEPCGNYSLCEVTVESEMFLKCKRLPDQLSSLHDRLNQNGRYYVKNNLSTEPVVPDDMIGELLREAQVSLLQVTDTEVAWQLTLEDFTLFREIKNTEYIEDLFQLHSSYGCPMIEKFSELVNREMFWVVTEVCRETNIMKRMKLIKHFIKIAKCCKDNKNFNSMFAIMSGLLHRCVSRLHATWEKLPSKYSKMFEDMETIMDPSRNMAKYRNLLNSDFVLPPVIPIFPVVKKDLTFIHLGNDSYVDGLINFEKLRMIAKEIRHNANLCSAKYEVNTAFLNTQNTLGSSLVSSMATLRRTRHRRPSILPNPRKLYEEAEMVRKVKCYLHNMPVITNEDELTNLSYQCEPPGCQARGERGAALDTAAPGSPSTLRGGPQSGRSAPAATHSVFQHMPIPMFHSGLFLSQSEPPATAAAAQQSDSVSTATVAENAERNSAVSQS